MKIFYWIWTFIGGFLWFITLMLVRLAYFLTLKLNKKNGVKKAIKVSRIWAQTTLFIFGIRVKVHNEEIVQEDETYVFVSNHRSMLDVPIAAVSTTQLVKFLAKEELEKAPFLGYAIKHLYVSVNRDNLKSKVRSFQKMRDIVKSGWSLWIYPEGTRADNLLPLNEFQDGAFTLAAKSNTRIAVAAFVDSGRHFPAKNPFPIRPGIVHVYWLGIIDGSDVEYAKTTAKEMIENKLREVSSQLHS